MKFHEESLEVKTTKKLEVVDITVGVDEVSRKSGVTKGLVNLWTVHSTACLSINEHDEGITISKTLMPTS